MIKKKIRDFIRKYRKKKGANGKDGLSFSTSGSFAFAGKGGKGSQGQGGDGGDAMVVADKESSGSMAIGGEGGRGGSSGVRGGRGGSETVIGRGVAIGGKGGDAE